jgi:ATP-dependent Clp protease ATP-binding subunit ClpB
MTSNIGSDIIQKAFDGIKEKDMLAASETAKIEVMERLKQSVRPEFLNRIDEIVMFHPLMRSQIRDIVELQLAYLRDMLQLKEISLTLKDAAIDWLGEEGFDPQYGARPLKRTIQKEVVNKISKMILGSEVQKGQTITLDAKAGELIFSIS